MTTRIAYQPCQATVGGRHCVLIGYCHPHGRKILWQLKRTAPIAVPIRSPIMGINAGNIGSSVNIAEKHLFWQLMPLYRNPISSRD
mgnify:CR=1 FL=1